MSVYLVGFKSKVATILSWTATFLTMSGSQLTITDRQALPQHPADRATIRPGPAVEVA